MNRLRSAYSRAIFLSLIASGIDFVATAPFAVAVEHLCETSEPQQVLPDLPPTPLIQVTLYKDAGRERIHLDEDRILNRWKRKGTWELRLRDGGFGDGKEASDDEAGIELASWMQEFGEGFERAWKRLSVQTTSSYDLKVKVKRLDLNRFRAGLEVFLRKRWMGLPGETKIVVSLELDKNQKPSFGIQFSRKL